MENNAKYFINFKDGQRAFHELEISHAFYQAFRRLELDNRKLENWDWRYREFNKVWEEILQRRALRIPKSLEICFSCKRKDKGADERISLCLV